MEFSALRLHTVEKDYACELTTNGTDSWETNLNELNPTDQYLCYVFVLILSDQNQEIDYQRNTSNNLILFPMDCHMYVYPAIINLQAALYPTSNSLLPTSMVCMFKPSLTSLNQERLVSWLALAINPRSADNNSPHQYLSARCPGQT